MATKPSRAAAILITVSAVILVSAIFWGLSAVKEARKNQAAMHELSATSQELGKGMKDKIGIEDTVDGATAKAQQMQEAMGKAAANMTGDGAKAIRAGEKMMGMMKVHITKYEGAYKAFMAPGGLEPKTLTAEAAIDERLKLLKTFEGANQEFTEFLKNADGAYREELKKENYPATEMEETARGFREGGNFPTLIAIRGTDAELCSAMAEYLTLLKAEWGKWKMSDDGAILFQNDSAAEKFKSYAVKLQDIADRQAAMQEKLMASQQKKATGKPSAVGGR